LECTVANGVALGCGSPESRRRITYRGLVESAPVEQRVGRRFQGDFFLAVLASEEAQSLVANEHLRIKAVPVNSSTRGVSHADDDEGLDDRQPYHFFVTNVIPNGTSVNGSLLSEPEQTTALHDGDFIGLGKLAGKQAGAVFSPVIVFRFSLSKSPLRDATLTEASRPAVLLNVPGAAASRRSKAGGAHERGSLPVVWECDDFGAMEPYAPPAGSVCTSLAGHVTPHFILLIGGKGLRPEATESRRRIVHGPPQQAPLGAPFVPLVIGRGHSTRFWQEVLREDVFQALSREHVVFESPCEGVAVDGAGVVVRSLSAKRPARVYAGPDDDCAIPVPVGKALPLQHGGVVVIFANAEASLWFTLVDFEAIQAPNTGRDVGEAARQMCADIAAPKALCRLPHLAGGAVAGGA